MDALVKWFNNISIKHKLYYIASIMFFLIAVELVTLYQILPVFWSRSSYSFNDIAPILTPTIAILLGASGLLLALAITTTIRKGIHEIQRVTQKIMRLDFSEQATPFSTDEIGQLTCAFNQMTSDLEKSILNQHQEINERRTQEKRLTVRYAITRVMTEYTSLTEIIPQILQILGEAFQMEYGGFWQLDTIKNQLYCANTWSSRDSNIKEFANASSQYIIEIGQLLPGKVWETKNACWIPDISQSPCIARLAEATKAGLCSAFAFPILFEKEILGIIEFFTYRHQPMDGNLLNLFTDISNSIAIFIEREHAQKRAASLSRLTGMSEVASNVLHNVGNTLNSVNTSVMLLNEKNSHSKINTLIELEKVLNEHQNDMNHFLTNDPRGQKIPELISLLADAWVKEKKYLAAEISSLMKNVTHIKNIIMMQQSLSYAIGVTDEIIVAELIEDAIALNKMAYEKAFIDIIRDYQKIKKVVIDKIRVFQILMNLVKNGIEAVIEGNKKDKKLFIRLDEKDDAHFIIEVSDNGSGIAPENITKIFSHRFTTKKTGHGFGLHTSALYAEELGGSLTATSDGIGQGATFTLTLPY